MIDADIRGKLARDALNAHSRSEDLLTSTVFGLLRYLPADAAIIPLMSRALPITLVGEEIRVGDVSSTHPPFLRLERAVSCDVVFWPSFQIHGQPDLLLRFGDADHQTVALVVVEAKLHSPKSGESDGDADTDARDDEAAIPKDQLARYWRGALEQAGRPAPDCCAIIYLTAHATPPVDELRDSLASDRTGTMRLAWMSWHDVWRTLHPLVRDSSVVSPAADLARLLEHRGFAPLNGFKQAVPTLTTSASFWQRRAWFSCKFPFTKHASHFWSQS